MSKTPKYFMYFPGNYRWSAAFINMLGRRLRRHRHQRIAQDRLLLEGKRADDDAAWFDACVQVADECARAMPRNSTPANIRFRRRSFYLRACNYYQMGERFRTPKDETALDAYRTGVDCFHRFAALTDVKIEIVEVPFEGGSLPGYFVHAQNTNAKRTPCVVFFDGLDVTKEIQYMRGVPDLIKRGISVLVMDGPGHRRGDPLPRHASAPRLRDRRQRLHRLPRDARRRRRRGKIGIVAISLGGYYAPRCAAMEPRFAACVAWGAIWDYHATWKRRIEAHSRPRCRCRGITSCGCSASDTLEEALKKLEPFRLDGVVQKMRCPFLLVHGAEDEQVPLADAQALYDACGSRRQDVARVHRRGRRRAALPARLPDAGLRHNVELVRGQADAGMIPPAFDQVESESGLVLRFRISHHFAAHSSAKFGIKGALAMSTLSSAAYEFEVPMSGCRKVIGTSNSPH